MREVTARHPVALRLRARRRQQRAASSDLPEVAGKQRRLPWAASWELRMTVAASFVVGERGSKARAANPSSSGQSFSARQVQLAAATCRAPADNAHVRSTKKTATRVLGRGGLSR